ncbi:hypothetical protein TcG_04337 [Trypanosoma cruzi]|nr:hypothetical protein TcG_04337 [Trypanosoma cruzi]
MSHVRERQHRRSFRQALLRAAVTFWVLFSLCGRTLAATRTLEISYDMLTPPPLPPTLSELNERLRLPHSSSPSSPFLRDGDGTSLCSVDHGCPLSSMAWASGTFTMSDVLTPASFLIASNLTLKLSLCCGYKYNGTLLRDEALYDVFLQVLLRASPFQVLTREEKRRMFPREHVIIMDTVRQRRYDANYVLTTEDVRQQNDGDGDVILLVSGAVGEGILRIPLYRAAEDLATAAPANINLKIANVAIKCKCPHTLLVMPLLQVRPDTLLPVSVLGLGSHCGVHPLLPPTTPHHGENIVQLREKAWAASVAVAPSQLPATRVQWVVTDTRTGSIVLDELLHVPTRTDSSGALLRHHANCSYFEVLPNHKYEVNLTVSRGTAVQRATGFFILRLPIDRPQDVERGPPQLHFGFERHLRLSERTRTYLELQGALSPQHQSAEYFGYWENTPLSDQPLPQILKRIRHNPYAEETALYPMFVGRNEIFFYVRDLDEVCDPVLLEVQEVWALQGILLQPSISPLTACHDDVPVEALVLKHVVATIRSSLQLPVRFQGTSWEPLQEQNFLEGRFDCTERGAGPCDIRTRVANGGTSGVLQMRKRGVADLAWVVRVEVNETALVPPHSLDPSVARIVANTVDEGGVVVVEVRSRPAVVVRRMSTMPNSVNVTLAMRLRRMKVHPPRSLEVAVDELPIGHWLVAAPLLLLSVDDAFVAELDTSGVPNVPQRLREGTLRFVAEDPGEAIDLGVPYTSRCPPRVVEHTVTVVALAAPPIVPALVPFYTEDDCVHLRAPRPRWKDEEARWHVPHCEEAPQSPPYIAGLEKGKRVEHNVSSLEEEEVQEVQVCGVQVYRWCDVVWTARNPVAAVTQTFSLRRCQSPPQLLFHKDGLQEPRGISLSVYALPLIEWLDGYDDVPDDMDVGGSAKNTTTQVPHYTARRVIPVAGYSATVGYSFNYSGLQQYFEVTFKYAHDAAHQLGVTQQHFERVGDDGLSDEMAAAAAAAPLLLRRSLLSLDGNKIRDDRNDRNTNDNDNNDSMADDKSILRVGDTEEDVNLEQQVADRARERDYALDLASDTRFFFTHLSGLRKVWFNGLDNSSHYPLLYKVWPSPTATGPSRDAAEFARRGLCLLQRGNISVFSVNPRGVVPVVENGVLPFCYPSFLFSRHPWLSTKYKFDFLWSCEDDGVIVVERRTPTASILRHNGPANDTRCSLTVRNDLTETVQKDTFLLRRVYPTPLPPTFAILSDNAAMGECFANGTTRSKQTTRLETNGSPDTTQRRTRTRWIFGKKLILHVDAHVGGRTSRWAALSVVPAVPSPVGTGRLLDSIHFLPLPRHPLALERGFGDATVLVSGIRVPGLYTFGYYHPDPMYPGVCPNSSIVETLHVVHAQVIEKELTVCGDSAVLKAVPIPREIGCEFFGQWEVVSLQTSENETWTSGANFTGIRFDHGRGPRTVVRGLPFGILTVRWAVYAVSPTDPDTQGNGEEEQEKQRGLLVDYEAVRLLVLTENLPSNRLVTLSQSVHLLATTSTLHWLLTETEASSSPLTLRRPRLRVETVSNESSTGSRFGAGHQVVIVTNLPIGLTRLQYELHLSPRAFGPMLTKRCPYVPRQEFEIERVSAFLSANTTLSHECDAYSGRGQISICLHAEGAQNRGILFTSSSSSLPSFGARLVEPASFEAIVKSGAARLEARGCSLPWWVASQTHWSNVHADATRRCVSVTVTAARHLHPQEVSHHMFLAQEQLGSSRLCPHGGDFMTSEIIDGATTWGDGGSTRNSLFRGGDIAQFLPFLHFATLTREERSMRPMLSLLGVPDIVTTELDISNEGKAVVVLLRLDTAQPKQMGGYVHAAQSSEDGRQRHSLLANCARGTVRASDVLNFWTEVNRPDGAEGHTAREWLEYVAAVREKHVGCEPLFVSLAHLLPRPDDTEATLRRRQLYRVPPKEQRLVTLDVIEQQLEGLQREYRWTREGIDVTGLPPELQAALARRRITKSQLDEIERERRAKRAEMKQAELPALPAKLTSEERFERILRLYEGVVEEGVAAIRLTLPPHEPFTVPHNLFLRAAVHKDVLCGTNVSAGADPASLVLFGRVEVVDVPPAVGASPAAIKQCEVEGGVPVIEVSASGTTFAAMDVFPTDRVLLEEVHNPNSTGLTETSPEVGLLPCLQQMHFGMRVAASSMTKKHLYLQLSPCPFFQMLSHADYDEQQDSELLQKKLFLPRLLRITLRGVLSEDSHTKGKTSVSFVVKVLPTLARLHLRPLPAPEEGTARSSWSGSIARRPLLMCEGDVRRRGAEFGIELIGDRWHDRVGGRGIHDDDITSLPENAWYENSAGRIGISGSISSSRSAVDGARYRSPHNVALINSFSIVEHHRLDSAHHLLLRHGGLYRSDFVNYLFSIMARPEITQRHQFVYRYNDTFVGVRIPAAQSDLNDLFHGDEYDGTFDDDHLPPIRSFSTIEEILFAVPGIATECRGCLLADTTYFMAGDLTGLWFFPPATSPPLDNRVLVEPLRVPFYAASRVPREWRFSTLCPTEAWDNLQLFLRHWQPPRLQRGSAPYLQFELVVYSLRDILGGEVPLSRRPNAILTGLPVSFTKLLKEGRGRRNSLAEVVFQVNTTAAERAHATMAADFSRYGRRHLHTVHDYLRDHRGSGGALAVNASVFLKVCVPSTAAVPEAQCSIVSVTHTLLIMEEPRLMSYYGRPRQGSWRSIFDPAALLHHAGTSLTGYIILPRLPALRRTLSLGNTHDVAPARIGLTVALFVAVVFLYAMATRLWAVICTLLWATLLFLVPEIIVGIYFVMHFLFWAFVM